MRLNVSLQWTFQGHNCIVNANMGMGSTVPPKTHSIIDCLCTDVCCMVGWRCVHEYVCVCGGVCTCVFRLMGLHSLGYPLINTALSDSWDLRLCLHPEQRELKWRVQRFATPVFFFFLFVLP